MPTRTRLALPVACYVVLLVAALQTLVVPVVANIRADLGVSTSAASWVVTANLLAAAVLTPMLGRLGDLYGRRPVMLGVLTVVLLGSVLAATTSSLPLLLAGRIAQAASFGLFPLAIGMLREELPPHRLTGAMALVSGMLSVGAGFGLVVTGLLMRHGGDYHQLFWLATVMTAIGLAGAWLLPHRPGAATGTLDWTGAALLGLGLVLLLLPLEEGNGWGWGSARVIGLLAAAVVVLTAFVLFERRVTHPLVSTRMLSHRPIVVANAAGLFFGFSMFAVFLAVSTLVQTPPAVAGYGFGATVLAASLVYLLPGTASGVLTAPLGGRLVARFGAKATLVIGAALAGTGFAMLAVLHSAAWQVILGALVVNTAVTFGYAALPALLIAHVEPAETGIANSVNSIARSVGMSLGTAFVVTMMTRNPVPGPLPLPREAQFVTVFAVGAALAVITAAAVGRLLPRAPRPRLTAPEMEADEALL
ncbi:MFS transporter [Actinoplanes lobatus]|uniref:MFS family permease n=1 Tax=Actinoplanes lobatus TaxID=113568 RepID=A0A7W7MIN4_9ACTN|nr:MFS transporter [Actinoplanes lobatus]MBB4751155.1 MFS family permease [Actinoplanes lobatus]GGN94619.1 MFS transporter [Actinoplanes lobatus]GIE44650.1 MFS transporter [Actinoplanes lobatus]